MSNITIAQSRVETMPKSNLKSRHLIQQIAFALMWSCGVIALLVLLGISFFVIYKGVFESYIQEGVWVLNWEFLTTRPRGGLGGEGGISTTIVTTIYLVGLTLLIATPLGVGAAIFLAEYAGEAKGKILPRLVGIARFGVETLAGVPSIIFGLFGFALFVLTMSFGFSLIAAGLSGACLILPVIIRASEEALFAVPETYRHGSLALGATKWQTIWNVVIPTATPGIITGIVLSIGRIISETAIFYVTLGGSIRMPTSLTSQGRSMALHLYYLAMETRAFDKAMTTGAILILTIVLINLAINLLSRRISASMNVRR